MHTPHAAKVGSKNGVNRMGKGRQLAAIYQFYWIPRRHDDPARLSCHRRRQVGSRDETTTRPGRSHLISL
jgi:hypothetical protein